jgi:NADH dehydrogenase [ubiquinone] 1 alpha subcomplex assembly factor 7
VGEAAGVTPLARLLQVRIAAGGPIPVSDYMADCLLHPEHGYYATREPFGPGGDFVTAPEISQMFGELLGLWLAQCWLDQGAPAPFTLAELGPGRGTLMADILRATARVPGFHQGAQVVLVEASARLRALQAARVAHARLSWAESTASLPEAPLLLVANEFFDALPIRQFQRDGRGWRERQVGLADGRLAFGLAAAAPRAELAWRLADTRDGDIVETCPAASPVMAAIAGRIARHGGAALIVDYGGWHSLGDTLQAVSRHAPQDPLAAPGEADLTAHVDFEALALAAGGLRVYGPAGQGELLEALGLRARAERLARSLSGEALASHLAAARRLTAPEEMGTLFKALALTPPGAPAPPGFAE